MGAETVLDALSGLMGEDPIGALASIVQFYQSIEKKFLIPGVYPKEYALISELIGNVLNEFAHPNPWSDPVSV